MVKFYLVSDESPEGFKLVANVDGLSPQKSFYMFPDDWGEAPPKSAWFTVTITEDPEFGKSYDVSLNFTKRDEDLAAEAAEKAAKAAERKLMQAKLVRFEFGKRMKAEIAIVNDTKGWDDAQFATYLAEPVVQEISSLLNDGAIDTARIVISSSDLSAYYTTEEVSGFVAQLQTFLDNEV